MAIPALAITLAVVGLLALGLFAANRGGALLIKAPADPAWTEVYLTTWFRADMQALNGAGVAPNLSEAKEYADNLRPLAEDMARFRVYLDKACLRAGLSENDAQQIYSARFIDDVLDRRVPTTAEVDRAVAEYRRR